MKPAPQKRGSFFIAQSIFFKFAVTLLIFSSVTMV